MKILILHLTFFIYSISLLSQDITNTLDASGLFTVKDASTTFFTITQLTGEVNILNTMRLENTSSSTTGVINKGIVRFIHNYGVGSTFMGLYSGNFTMTGNYNSAFGRSSLSSNTTGNENSAFGPFSLYYNTTGAKNSAFGASSLFFNTAGNDNSAFGRSSLYSNTTGNYNSAFGYSSLYLNTTGYNNSAFGDNSLFSNTTGNSNTALGYSALLSNTTGSINTAVGIYALYYNTTGSNNTAMGRSCLESNTEGNYNSAFGYSAGSNITTGSNLTCVGYNAEPTSASATNQITLGNGSVNSLRCNVTTITSLSDQRDKKNITDLSLGLDFITKLKPRQFNWDKREWYENDLSDGSKMKEEPTAGFIAQELDEAQTSADAEWLNLVLKDNPEKWEATPGNLLPVMVKAIQELNEKNEQLKIKNAELEKRLSQFEEVQTLIIKKFEVLESKETLNVQIVKAENNNQ
ncbi:MAG: tail fiber domain-containing protein [Ignavibacteriaceae bacterium]|jgi:hypothetical protein|nr:tail fiber domain-containing protein [Ignavibacteriaceae bacterium]MCU0405836.1 tail fiber domain-containing protein [Ignavibacteriaceae bacterium]MCU0413576.1 tail fiber domain-containing protein [Ignavibacteriaceae bacterium]